MGRNRALSINQQGEKSHSTQVFPRSLPTFCFPPPWECTAATLMNTSLHLPPSDDLPSGILPPHISLSHLKSSFELAPHLLAHLVSSLMASPGTHSFVQLGRLRRRSSHSQMQGGSRKCSQCDSFVHCWNFFTQGKGG